MKTVGWKKRFFPAVFVLLCLLAGCGTQQPEAEPTPQPPQQSVEEKDFQPPAPPTPEQKAKEMVAAMSVEEKRTAVGLVIQEVVWDGENAHVRLTGAGAEELADLRKRWREDSK